MSIIDLIRMYKLTPWCITVQDVIDGDLCEQFPTLPLDLQRKIADELDRTPGEILKKLEDIRNKIV
jgi:splicing factor 3B subunit 3